MFDGVGTQVFDARLNLWVPSRRNFLNDVLVPSVMLSRSKHIQRRINHLPIGNGPATTCRLLVTLEPNRIDVNRDDTFACLRGPVCDQKDDGERSDATWSSGFER
jgi:hypothetical protein